MQFLYPYYLFALSAIAIPVIIHLFNFRKYKKVYFTNVAFIHELKLQSKKRSRLKHLLVLILRILAVISLVFAFSQPFIPSENFSNEQKALQSLSVFVDNSYSMEAVGSNGMMLDVSIDKAVEIAMAYAPSTAFQILTSDFEGRHHRFVNKDEFISLLKDLKLSPVSRKLSEIMKRQEESLKERIATGKTAYIVSDFQKNFTDIQNCISDTQVFYYLVPLKTNKINNLFIDSCWFESPLHLKGQHVKLIVRVRNSGDELIEKVPLKLIVNNNQKAVNSFDIGPASVNDVEISYVESEYGMQWCTLEITDNPVVYDDKLFFSYNILPSVKVLAVNATVPNVYINALLGKDSAFILKNVSVNNIDFSLLQSYNLIITNELDEISSGLAAELQKFVQNGGSLLVIPSAKINTESYRMFLSSMQSNYFIDDRIPPQKVSGINLQSEVFSDVFESLPQNMDMPVVQRAWRISKNSRTVQEDLLTLQNGDVFLTRQQFGYGDIYLLAVPLRPEFSSFPKHAVFVPALYRIALLSQQQSPLYHIIGKDDQITIGNPVSESQDHYFIVKKLEGDEEIIPGRAQTAYNTVLDMKGQIKLSGNYVLIQDKKEIAPLSFNYSRDESALSYYSAEELKELIKKAGLKNVKVLDHADKNLTGEIITRQQGMQLWKIFIIMALAFLAAEILILRFWGRQEK